MLGATLIGQSCISDDPNHCEHQDGDASCEAGFYCNNCVASDKNGGCLSIEAIDEACHSAVSDGGTPSGSTDDATDGTDGDTGGPATMGDTGPAVCGGDACPANAPYCVDGSCSSCADVGGDDYCAGEDESTPVCGATGECVQCSPDNASACGGSTAFCDPTGTCSGCFEHSQCMTDDNEGPGCDIAMGTCLPETLVYYVSTPACVGAETGFGDADDPWCSLESAEAVIAGNSGVTIHFAPGDYSQTLESSNGGVAVLIGRGGGVPATQSLVPRVQVSNNSRLYTSNLRLSGDGGAGLVCANGGTLWARDTEVVDSIGGYGVEAGVACEVTIERSVIAGNENGGINTTNAEVILRSSGVLYNGGDGITAEDGSFEINHGTIIQNGISSAGNNVACSAGVDLVVRNSVVMHEIEQSFGGCGGITVRNSVIDDDPFVSKDDGVTYQQYSDGYFQSPSDEDNPHVTGSAPFADVAVREAGPPYVDIDGEAYDLTLGATSWAGADQP